MRRNRKTIIGRLALTALLAALTCPCLFAQAKNGNVKWFKPFNLEGKVDEKDKFDTKPGLTVYEFPSGGWKGKKFCIYVPKTYSPERPIPLVVTFHGNAWTPEREIGSWRKLPDEGGYLLVSLPGAGHGNFESVDPNTLKSVSHAIEVMIRANRINAEKCHEAVEDMFRRLVGSFNIDRKRVLATGYSGGGQTLWLIGWGHPEFFTALCFRAANLPFAVEEKAFTDFFMQPGLIEKWRTRPIFVFWGEKDHPVILKAAKNVEHKFMKRPCGEGPYTLRAFHEVVKAEKLTHEVLPGYDHGKAAAPDVASKWFVEKAVPSIVSLSDGVTVRHYRKELERLEATLERGERVDGIVAALEKAATNDDEAGREAVAILENFKKLLEEKIRTLSKLAECRPAAALTYSNDLGRTFAGLPEDEQVKQIRKDLESAGGRHLKELVGIVAEIEKVKGDVGHPSRGKTVPQRLTRLEKRLDTLVKNATAPENIRREAEKTLDECKALSPGEQAAGPSHGGGACPKGGRAGSARGK